jgi:hypothetical protein
MIAAEHTAEEDVGSHDDAILYLWRHEKLDTYEIAQRRGLKECQVANRLLHLREAGK